MSAHTALKHLMTERACMLVSQHLQHLKGKIEVAMPRAVINVHSIKQVGSPVISV